MERNKLKKRDERIVREYLKKLSRKDSPNRARAIEEIAPKYDLTPQGVRLVLIREGVYKQEEQLCEERL